MARRLTYEEVEKFIEVEGDSGCKLLSEEYIDSRKKLRIQCKCGNEFEAHFNAFKSNNKRQCNKCGNKEANENRRIPYKDIKHFIEIESNSGCKLLTKEYLNVESPLLIQCLCGRVYKTNFKTFKHQDKYKCDICSGVKLDYEYVKKYIEENSDCEVLSNNYKNNKTKLMLRCKCGESFKTTFGLFVSKDKRRCNLCSEKNRSKKRTYTYKYVKNFIEVVSNSNCKLVSEEYTNSSHELIIKCGCKNIFSTTFSQFKNNGIRRCNNCSNKIIGDLKRKSLGAFIEEVYELVGNEYVFLEEYKGANMPIKCRHNTCENIWSISPSNFLRGRRCPQCAESKGEKSIREYLQDKNIEFQQEYTFENLLSNKGNPLRFDFSIFHNKKIELLIEYDGEFHFSRQYENDGFDILQIHDQRKNQYCKDNNIPLIRIPYWQFDKIEEILDKWLDKYGLINY